MPEIRKRKKGYGSLLLFFVVMLLLTVASSLYDTWTVAKVRTAYARAKAVEIKMEGSGRILASKTVFCPIQEGYRVEEVLVSQGELVEEGEVLFRYQMSSLEEEQKRRKKEMEKLRLEMEKEQVSAQEFSGVTQMELANREAAIAARELEQGIRAYEQAQADHQETLLKWKEEYELKKTILEEELLWQKEQEYESGLSGLGGSRNNRDAALRAARRNVEDLEEKLEELEQADEGDEGAIASARKKLERAEEDLEELNEVWEDQIDAERSKLDYIDDGHIRVEDGMTSGQVDLRLRYEAQLEQAEASLEEMETDVEGLREALGDAEGKKQIAALEDERTRLTREQKASLAKLNRRGLELDLEEQSQALAKVEQLMGEEGAVAAEAAGTILEAGLTPGQKTVGTELVRIGTGGLMFEGSFKLEEEEEQRLFPGDRLAVGAAGQERRMETVIASVNLLGEHPDKNQDDEALRTFQAEVIGGDFLIGEQTRYECVKQSPRFETVIPLDGLRKDQSGYYCLVVRIQKGVLGEELVAERIDLTLLEKGNTEAAVEGALYQDDPIVVDSSRMVDRGSRIRVMEEW